MDYPRRGHSLISPLDKTAAILIGDNFKCTFLNENDRIPIRISLKFVPRSPVDNKAALVQVMAWRWTGDKPLPEPMLTQFTGAYMRHWGRWVNMVYSVATHITSAYGQYQLSTTDHNKNTG